MTVLEIIHGEIDDLLTLESGLTEWEVEFIESMGRRRDTGDYIEWRLAKRIHQIWDRTCGNG